MDVDDDKSDPGPGPGLDPARRLVVWSARAWVHAHLTRCPVFRVLADVYAGAGAFEAAEAIDDLFAVISTGQDRPQSWGLPGCGCAGCVHMTVSEALLAESLACLQRHRGRDAALALAGLMAPAAVGHALGPARRWSLALSAQGLILPQSGPPAQTAALGVGPPRTTH